MAARGALPGRRHRLARASSPAYGVEGHRCALPFRQAGSAAGRKTQSAYGFRV
jgi:hypothetical protein